MNIEKLPAANHHRRAIEALGFVPRVLEDDDDPRQGTHFVPGTEPDPTLPILVVIEEDETRLIVRHPGGTLYGVTFDRLCPANVVNQAVAAAVEGHRS